MASNSGGLNFFQQLFSRPRAPPPPRRPTPNPVEHQEADMSSWVHVLQQTVVIAAGCYMMYKVYDTLDITGRKEEKQVAQSKKQAFVAALREHFAHSKHIDVDKLVQQDFDTHECALMSHVAFPKDIEVSFEDIGGLEAAKTAMYEAISLPLERPELFEAHGAFARVLQAPKGILFYGPPGTGKTMMAKAIAKSSGVTFINVNFSVLLDKYLGESQKLVHALFSLARKVAPSIIFVDEIDSFLVKRGSASDNGNFNLLESQLTAQFMQLWDGLTSDGDARVIVLAASNRPQDLDPAVMRRLPRSFKFGLPDEKTRSVILKLLMRGAPLDESCDLDIVAAHTQDYSGSDLNEMCKVATLKRVRRAAALEKGQIPPPLSLQDFLEAVAEVPHTGVAAKEYSFEEDDQKAAHMRERMRRQQEREAAANTSAVDESGDPRDVANALKFIGALMNLQHMGVGPGSSVGGRSDQKE